MTVLEKTFMAVVGIGLIAIPSSLFLNRSTPERRAVVPVLASEWREFDPGSSVMIPTGRDGEKPMRYQVSRSRFWELTVSLDGEKQKLHVAAEDEAIAKSKTVEVIYQYLRDGQLRIIEMRLP